MKSMKKLFFTLCGIFFILPAWADDNNADILLNKVILQLQAQQWVTTKSALVNVGISAAVSDQGVEKIQNNALLKLQQLAPKGDWHILSFDRQQDKSGLESIQMTAQARLSQDELGGLRDKAKSISKPGETYTIDAVQFIPSDDEIRAANVTLRNNLYQQAKTEIDTLNTIYPEQKYYLHKIDFTFTPPVMPMAQNMVYGAKIATARAVPLSVGNKAELQATVELASTSDKPPLPKVAHT
jgi:hypothetical protein